MAIDPWWAGHGDERYWMEITLRDDLGGDLMAPQHNAHGKEVWHYSLVQYTEPGDIVFHWHQDWVGEPAIVGWSEVVGPLSSDSMEWQARGTYGRARGHSDELPNWVMPLGGLHEFDRPVTRRILNERFDEVASAIEGKKYGPFYKYRSDELRAFQGYLTKFPAALVPLVRRLSRTKLPTPPDNRSLPPGGRGATSVGQGRMADTALRIAIERYAVKKAVEHYKKLGATDIDILGKPYDLRVRLNGKERHVEVKGTTADGAVRVVLTIGEVNHATRNWPRTDLFVVDGIGYEKKTPDQYKLTGGTARLWSDWAPDSNALHATEFMYDLPAGGAI